MTVTSPGRDTDAGAPARVDDLTARVEAVRLLVEAGTGVLPEQRLDPARDLVERAGQRLALSRDHTVVALAGATGGGKSSLFNCLARNDLSPVGVRRPTTSQAYACVWGGAGTGLLDWLKVPAGHRHAARGAGHGRDQQPLRGLVLVDLPDIDSVHQAHQVEVDRLLALVDVMVWVADPQKYADALLHERYLRRYARHQGVTVVVLNQADRLAPADTARCLADLRRLLAEDGMPEVPVLATSAAPAGQPPAAHLPAEHPAAEQPSAALAAEPDAGVAALRAVLATAVAGRQAWLHRLGADLDRTGTDLADLAGDPVPAPAGTGRDELVAALAAATGVDVVAQAAAGSYARQAHLALGSPVLRLWRRRRRDPLARLRLDGPDRPLILPPPARTQPAAAALAARTVAAQAGTGLPEPWRGAVATAVQDRLGELPAALDRAIAGTDLGVGRPRWWWRLVGGWQWLLTLCVAAGLGWLAVRLILIGLGAPAQAAPTGAGLPVPALLLVGGLAGAAVTTALVGPAIAAGTRRAHARARARLLDAVGGVADALLLVPVQDLLSRYARVRESITRLRREW